MESHEDLGQMIEGVLQHRTDPQYYLVLADFLEEMGDPLGELVRLSVHSRDTTLPAARRRKITKGWHGLNMQIERQLYGQGVRIHGESVSGPQEGSPSLHYVYVVGFRVLNSSRDLSSHVPVSTLPLQMQRGIILFLCQNIVNGGHQGRKTTSNEFATDESVFVLHRLWTGLSMLTLILNPRDLSRARHEVPAIISQINHLLDLHPDLAERDREYLEQRRYFLIQAVRETALGQAPDLIEQINALLKRLGLGGIT